MEAPICIVGAGPAGTTTALSLAKKGIPCILVDKSNFPRFRADGNGMRSSVVDILASIDPDLAEKFKRAPFQKPMLGAEFVFPGEKTVKTPFPQDPPKMYLATRFAFDDFLLEEAKSQSSIEVIEGLELEHYRRENDGLVLTDASGQNSIKARLTIIANGAYSKFATNLSGHQILPKDYGDYTRHYYENVPGVGENVAPTAVFLEELAPHYLFYHTTPEGLFAIGLGMNGQKVKDQSVELDQLLMKLLQTKLPELYERVMAGKLLHAHQHRLPYGGHKDPLSGEGFMLVGDAARLNDPFTFVGTDIAMESGVIAAGQAQRSVENADYSAATLKSYDNAIHERFQDMFKRQKRFHSLSANAKLVKLAFTRVLSDKRLQSLVRTTVLDAAGSRELQDHPAFSELSAYSY